MSDLSIILCTCNARARLQPTLEHLAAQRVPPQITWDLILVDNNSTDGTADFARELWSTLSTVPLQILHEPTQGVAHARARGLAAARSALLGMVDDDNWLDAEWISTAVAVMEAHPDAGACGGFNTAHYEIDPPAWLPAVAGALAVGGQGDAAGDVTDSRGLLWGAGLVLRRTAWQQATALGIPHALSGRVGTSLTSGEDSEMCLLLRLAGWRLRYDPRLRLTHAIGAQRLTWQYLRRLSHGAGAASPLLDGYYVALRHDGPWRAVDRLRWSWPWQAARAAQAAWRHPMTRITAWAGAGVGSTTVLECEAARGRFATLMQLRGAYSRRIQQVLAARRAQAHGGVPRRPAATLAHAVSPRAGTAGGATHAS